MGTNPGCKYSWISWQYQNSAYVEEKILVRKTLYLRVNFPLEGKEEIQKNNI